MRNSDHGLSGAPQALRDAAVAADLLYCKLLRIENGLRRATTDREQVELKLEHARTKLALDVARRRFNRLHATHTDAA